MKYIRQTRSPLTFREVEAIDILNPGIDAYAGFAWAFFCFIDAKLGGVQASDIPALLLQQN